MPAQLATRMSEVEYHGVIASINSTLQPLSGFGVLSLLLPFLLVDVITVTLLSLMDPWLLITPWDSPLADLLLPLGMEFFVVFCSFPLMALAVNKKMEEVQRRVRGLLDDASRRFGPRGVAFQLKQGMLNNGAGTNLWVEVQVVPVIHMQSPVPVPVPTVCPILLPANAQPANGHTGASTSATPSAATTPSAQPPTTAGPSSDAAGESMAAATAAAVAAGANLTAQQVEYLRVVQENQLLRQYLAQCQALIGQLGQQLAQQQPTAAPATPLPSAPSGAQPDGTGAPAVPVG